MKKKMDAEKSWYKDCLERVKNTSSINFKHAYAKMMSTKGILQLSENIIDYCEKRKLIKEKEGNLYVSSMI